MNHHHKQGNQPKQSQKWVTSWEAPSSSGKKRKKKENQSFQKAVNKQKAERASQQTSLPKKTVSLFCFLCFFRHPLLRNTTELPILLLLLLLFYFSFFFSPFDLMITFYHINSFCFCLFYYIYFFSFFLYLSHSHSLNMGFRCCLYELSCEILSFHSACHLLDL